MLSASKTSTFSIISQWYELQHNFKRCNVAGIIILYLIKIIYMELSRLSRIFNYDLRIYLKIWKFEDVGVW